MCIYIYIYIYIRALYVRKTSVRPAARQRTGHTCHNLPPSEIDLGLFWADFAGSAGVSQVVRMTPPCSSAARQGRRLTSILIMIMIMIIMIAIVIVIVIRSNSNSNSLVANGPGQPRVQTLECTGAQVHTTSNTALKIPTEQQNPCAFCKPGNARHAPRSLLLGGAGAEHRSYV